MTRVEELETAVATLPKEEYQEFRNWFYERDWERWDSEIEADSKAGKLDFLVKEAMEDKKRKRVKDL